MLNVCPARHVPAAGGAGTTFVCPGASGGAVGAAIAFDDVPAPVVGVGVGVGVGTIAEAFGAGVVPGAALAVGV